MIFAYCLLLLSTYCCEQVQAHELNRSQSNSLFLVPWRVTAGIRGCCQAVVPPSAVVRVIIHLMWIWLLCGHRRRLDSMERDRTITGRCIGVLYTCMRTLTSPIHTVLHAHWHCHQHAVDSSHLWDRNFVGSISEEVGYLFPIIIWFSLHRKKDFRG